MKTLINDMFSQHETGVQLLEWGGGAVTSLPGRLTNPRTIFRRRRVPALRIVPPAGEKVDLLKYANGAKESSRNWEAFVFASLAACALWALLIALL
jgi:hypothetical protein